MVCSLRNVAAALADLAPRAKRQPSLSCQLVIKGAGDSVGAFNICPLLLMIPHPMLTGHLKPLLVVQLETFCTGLCPTLLWPDSLPPMACRCWWCT